MSEQDQNPYAPPIDAPEAPTSSPRPRNVDVATTGQRVAGAFLIANALFVFIEAAITTATPGSADATPGGAIVPAMIDLGIGVSLLSGSAKALKWALVRVALGVVLWTGVQASRGEWVVMAMQLVLGAAFLLLLIGEAGRARIAAGASAFGVYALVSLLGIVSIVGGVNPLAGVTGALRTDLDPVPGHVLTGVMTRYTVTTPDDHWLVRKAEAAKKDNALVDRWLVRADKDAHLLILVEDLGGANLPVGAYADAVLDGAKKAQKDVAVLERHPLSGHLDDGVFLHTTSTLNGLSLEYYYAVISEGGHLYQLITFAMRAAFPPLAADFRGMIDSFHAPPAAPALP